MGAIIMTKCKNCETVNKELKEIKELWDRANKGAAKFCLANLEDTSEWDEFYYKLRMLLEKQL